MKNFNKAIRIPALQLPNILPNDKAIRNRGSYMPEIWELEYSICSYLNSLSDKELLERHADIIKNMQSLTSLDRHIIPIEEGFLSSWYWFRKEHQTRYEIIKRNLNTTKTIEGVPIKTPTNHYVHIRPSYPNSCDVLYRYIKQKYAENLLTKGELILKPSSSMSQHQDKARYDIENIKLHNITNAKVTTMDGKEIPVIGSVTCTSTTHDYYLYSMSTDFDPILQKEFGGTSVIIKNPIEFSKRLEIWGKKNLPEWWFANLCVNYFDPFEHNINAEFDALIYKDFKFSYQREYRFAFFSEIPAKNEIFINIGSIEDIAEIYFL